MSKYIEIPEEIKKRIKIKNIKDNFGHDLNGMYCDIFLDNKKVGYFNDDGCGGETEQHFDNKDAFKEIIALLETHQWRHKMFTELDWSFYENESRIEDYSVFVSIIEHLYDDKQKEKALKKIAKKSEKAIVYGKWNSYTSTSFKGGMSLANMIRSYGLPKVQQVIDKEIKPKLEQGQEILNPNFEELGLKK